MYPVSNCVAHNQQMAPSVLLNYGTGSTLILTGRGRDRGPALSMCAVLCMILGLWRWTFFGGGGEGSC